MLPVFWLTMNILKPMKNLTRSTSKKQMVLELEVHVIGTIMGKYLQKIF